MNGEIHQVHRHDPLAQHFEVTHTNFECMGSATSAAIIHMHKPLLAAFDKEHKSHFWEGKEQPTLCTVGDACSKMGLDFVPIG